MSLIAREKNSGTMEVVSTLPIKDIEFIMGKFISSVLLIVIGLGITSVHLFTLINVGTNIDYGAVFTGYLGLIMLGSVYASIGTFASSVTDNIPLAAVLSNILNSMNIAGDSGMWWAVIIGANLGGNLTPIGSASTLVAVTIMHKHDLKISFMGFVRKAFPFAILHIFLATLYVLFILKSHL